MVLARRLVVLALVAASACATAPKPKPPPPPPPKPPEPAALLEGCAARLESWGGIQYACADFAATYVEVEGTPAARLADAMEGAHPASPEILMAEEEATLPFPLPGLVARRLVFTRAGETQPAHVALVAAASADDHTRLAQCGGLSGGTLPPVCPDLVGGLLAYGPPAEPAPTPPSAGPPRLLGESVPLPEGCHAGGDAEGWTVIACPDATLMWIEAPEVDLDPEDLVEEIETGYRGSFDLVSTTVKGCTLRGRTALCRRFHLAVPESARADTILLAVAVTEDRTAVLQCVYEGERLPALCAAVVGLP